MGLERGGKKLVKYCISMNLDSLKDISFRAKYKRVVRLLKSNFFLFENQPYRAKYS